MKSFFAIIVSGFACAGVAKVFPFLFHRDGSCVIRTDWDDSRQIRAAL